MTISIGFWQYPPCTLCAPVVNLSHSSLFENSAQRCRASAAQGARPSVAAARPALPAMQHVGARKVGPFAKIQEMKLLQLVSSWKIQVRTSGFQSHMLCL